MHTHTYSTTLGPELSVSRTWTVKGLAHGPNSGLIAGLEYSNSVQNVTRLRIRLFSGIFQIVWKFESEKLLILNVCTNIYKIQ